MLKMFVICMCAACTRDFWQKAFTTVVEIISQFKADSVTVCVGSRVKGSDPVPSLRRTSVT